jgi:hypothetical protein
VSRSIASGDFARYWSDGLFVMANIVIVACLFIIMSISVNEQSKYSCIYI